MRLTPLDLGQLTNDPALALANEGVATVKNPSPPKVLCSQSMAAFVIEHPRMGPILYDTGIAPNSAEVWPPGMEEFVAATRYGPEHQIEAALQLAGYEIDDIRGIIISHLHLDHAGGLEAFRGREIPIYVHEAELKSAFYSVATRQDVGPYLPHYLDFSFRWTPLHGDVIELASGLTLHRAQGHAAGLLMLQADMTNAGTFLLVSDEFPLSLNYLEPRPQGWINRDTAAWWRALSYTQLLASRTDARVVFGHDVENFAELRQQKYYD